jgi:UDP-galactopyranose mutase
VPRAENAALFRKYQALADATPDVTFVGRLASYRYYNMDQVVAQALSVYTRMVKAESHAPALSHAERTIALGAGGV